MKSVLISLLIVLSLYSCQNHNIKSITTPSDITNIPIRSDTIAKFVPLFQYKDFAFLDSVRQCRRPFHWLNFGHLFDSDFLSNDVETTVDQIDTIIMGGKKIYAIRTESRPPDCNYHVCGTLCLIFFFEGENKKFIKASKFQPESVSIMGSYGSSPETKLIHIGSQKYAYEVKPSYMGQGEFVDDYLLFEVDDTLGLQQIFSFVTLNEYDAINCNDTASNEVKCFSYGSLVTFKQNESNHYQIMIAKKGTCPGRDKIINIDSTLEFSYNDGRYILTKAEINEKNTGSQSR